MQYHVNEMLKRTRTGDSAVFGDMADEHHGDAAGFRGGRQCRGHRADLGHPTDHTVGVAGVHGLNRIDDHQARTHRLDVAEHGRNVGLRGQEDLVVTASGALGTHPDLSRRLFTGDVERTPPRLRPPMGHLQKQGRFSDARISRQQAHRTGHHTAAEYPVEFAHAGGKMSGAIRIDAADRNRRRGRDGAAPDCAGGSGSEGDLIEGAPGFALGASPEPLRGDVSALGAAILRSRFSHPHDASRRG